MLEQLWSTIIELLGLNSQNAPTISEMALRTFFVYVYALMLVRVGETRFLGQNTAFDAILGFILGSILSRMVTGNSPFFATLIASAILVALHWFFAAVAFRHDPVSKLVKGRARPLIKGGKVQWEQMQRANIGKRDLDQSLRRNANTEDLTEIQAAYLERDGQISFIKKKHAPTILDVTVEDGVQTVRVQWN